MAITTVEEVRRVGQIAGDYTDEEIQEELEIVEAELYDRYTLPKRSQFSVDDDYTDFYIFPKEVHEIIRVQGAVETSVDPSGYTTLDVGSDYTFTENNNHITLTTSAISEYDGDIMRVQHIPRVYSRIAAVQTALNLIDTTTIIDGENTTSPKAIQLMARLKRYKQSLFNGVRFQRSSPNEDFDKYDYVSYTQSNFR